MAHADLAHVLAYEARRKALLVALREQRALTIGQLHILVHEGPYADDLATITVRELLDPSLSKPMLAPREHETETAAIMRVFRDQPSTWLASSFFVRYMGLRRWTAQKLLAELVARGLLERTGSTSTTRYRLAAQSDVRARVRSGSEE
jgi:hypothetical protein